MHLLSKPAQYNLQKEKHYEHFHHTKIAFTERSWTGEAFIPKEYASDFVEEYRKLDTLFSKDTQEVPYHINFTFLIDTSIFHKPEENQVSSKLTDFLDDIFFLKETDEGTKTYKKQLKKMRSFINRTENAVFLYVWAIRKPSHPFSAILKEEIRKSISEHGIRAKNQWVKELKARRKDYQKWKDEGYSIQQIEELDFPFQQQIVWNCERRDSDFLEKLMRHSTQDPALFFQAVQLLHVYFHEMITLMETDFAENFITIQKKEGHIYVFLKDSTPVLSQLFLDHEVFHDSLPKVRRTGTGSVNRYYSLHELNHEIEGVDESFISVLKTISRWVTARLPDGQIPSMPHGKWVHPIEGMLAEKLGLRYMFFEDHTFVGGPNGKELLVKAHTLSEPNDLGFSQDFLFPIFDPDSWDNLTPAQCALLAYACCLYHDVCIQDNYLLEEHPIKNARHEFDFILHTKERNKSLQPLKTNLASGSEKKEKEKEKRHLPAPKEEHWVSFHFRRLRKNQSASDRAKSNARKYGIPQLPIGFTFVDAFVKGEKAEDVQDMHISALEVFNKTLRKVNTYHPEATE